MFQTLMITFREGLEAFLIIATEPWGPEGEYGQWFSYSLDILPLGWLIYAYFADRKMTSSNQPA